MGCRVKSTGKLVQASRSFKLDGFSRFLTIDTKTFGTEILDPKQLDCDDPTSTILNESSPWEEALNLATSPPFPKRNDGIIHATHSVNGLFLSADLCPATQDRFETGFFKELENIVHRTHHPVPIALAISGSWIRHHASDFQILQSLIEMEVLKVTWVNHSKTHPFRKGERDEDNFLLESGVDPDREIEGLEIELLRNGETPSTFFRFPGLISNEFWMKALRRHSLIPVGSDAWIALREKPKSGSIILVHANGNEPEGIRRFLKMLPEIEAIGPFLPLSELF